MRKIAVVVVSAFVASLMIGSSVSALSSSVVKFSDQPGDLGHPAYDMLMEPTAYWPDTSPVGSAGYLDMLGGKLKIDKIGILTASLTVASPLTDESLLPQGVKAVWWTWFFSKDTSFFSADYAVHVCWDGSAVEGFVLVRGQDDPVRPVKFCSVVGDQIVVEFDGGFVEGSVGWFAESICWNHPTPYTDQGFLPSASWFAADITDGPFLPWLPMPT